MPVKSIRSIIAPSRTPMVEAEADRAVKLKILYMTPRSKVRVLCGDTGKIARFQNIPLELWTSDTVGSTAHFSSSFKEKNNTPFLTVEADCEKMFKHF